MTMAVTISLLSDVDIMIRVATSAVSTTIDRSDVLSNVGGASGMGWIWPEHTSPLFKTGKLG